MCTFSIAKPYSQLSKLLLTYMTAKDDGTQGHVGEVQGQGQQIGRRGADERANSKHQNRVRTLQVGNNTEQYSADENSKCQE